MVKYSVGTTALMFNEAFTETTIFLQKKTHTSSSVAFWNHFCCRWRVTMNSPNGWTIYNMSHSTQNLGIVCKSYDSLDILDTFELRDRYSHIVFANVASQIATWRNPRILRSKKSWLHTVSLGSPSWRFPSAVASSVDSGAGCSGRWKKNADFAGEMKRNCRPLLVGNVWIVKGLLEYL